MSEFKFTARDDGGAVIDGSLDAANQAEALEIISSNGFVPLTLNDKAVSSPSSSSGGGASHRRRGRGAAVKEKTKKEKAPSAKAAAKAAAKSKGKEDGKSALQMEIKLPAGMTRVKPKELMVLTRQMATLVNAGLPLVRSLEVLEKQTKNTVLKSALYEMVDSIKSGSTFAESLTQHPKIFDKLYVNMVRAGELGGVLDKVLLSLSEFMEKLQKIKGKVVSAMVYPAVVMTMATLILIFLMIFIIPQFEKIFTDVLGEGSQLPPLTVLVIGISSFMMSKWWLIIAVVVGSVILFRVMAATTGGRKIVDKLKLKLPMFGSLIVKSSISRMTRTLGTLMDSGVPVLQALTIVRETSGNVVLADAINSVHDSVKEGENMAPPMDATKLFPPMVISMVEVGEETGELPDMLMRIADNYEEEVDNAVNALTSIIEPVMIVALAFIVGTIVIALFLPLIKLITGLDGG